MIIHSAAYVKQMDFVIKTLDHTSSFKWIRFAGFPLMSIKRPAFTRLYSHVATSSSAAPAVTHILSIWVGCFSLQQSQELCWTPETLNHSYLYYYTLLPILPFSKYDGDAPWLLIFILSYEKKSLYHHKVKCSRPIYIMSCKWLAG